MLINLYQGGPLLKLINPESANFYLTPTVGLYNEDKYTYLNNLLQCLISLDFFVIFFLKKTYLIKNKT